MVVFWLQFRVKVKLGVGVSKNEVTTSVHDHY